MNAAFHLSGPVYLVRPRATSDRPDLSARPPAVWSNGPLKALSRWIGLFCNPFEEPLRSGTIPDQTPLGIVAKLERMGRMVVVATVTEQLRRAVVECGQTRYQISKATGVSASVLSRFVASGQGLRGENLDKLCTYLGLVLTTKAGKPRKER